MLFFKLQVFRPPDSPYLKRAQQTSKAQGGLWRMATETHGATRRAAIPQRPPAPLCSTKGDPLCHELGGGFFHVGHREPRLVRVGLIRPQRLVSSGLRRWSHQAPKGPPPAKGRLLLGVKHHPKSSRPGPDHNMELWSLLAAFLTEPTLQRQPEEGCWWAGRSHGQPGLGPDAGLGHSIWVETLREEKHEKSRTATVFVLPKDQSFLSNEHFPFSLKTSRHLPLFRACQKQLINTDQGWDVTSPALSSPAWKLCFLELAALKSLLFVPWLDFF